MLGFGLVSKAKEALDTYESQDPHLAGQVRRAVGGVLIADGLVGLENPLDGRKSRPGLLGYLMPILFCGAWLAVSLALFSAFDGDIKNPLETNGVVTQITRGSETCGLRATYTVDGATYTANSAVSSSSYCSKAPGDPVTVVYRAGHPEVSTVKDDGVLGLMKWVFIGFGGIGLAAAIVGFLVRVAAIVFGIGLYRSGARMVRENPRPDNVQDSDYVAKAKAHIIGLLRPGGAIGVAGSAVGSVLRAAAAGAQQQPAAAPTPPPAAPPATPYASGWYPTPDGVHERWHDGYQWTEHVRPIGAPPAPVQ